MSHRPLRIGLTGSIGMGKSAVAAMMQRAGVPVFDADAEVHRLQGPGGALLPAIEARFPGSTGAEGVNRARLREYVVGYPAELKALERIVHPAVQRGREAFLSRHRAHALVVFDIPLLFETRAERKLDKVIVVSAPRFLQRRRVLARPGMTNHRFHSLLASQTADHIKRRRADFVIRTGRPIWRTRQQVMRLLACLRGSLSR